MAEKTFSITFSGYWGESVIDSIPKSSGVYCVYGAIENPNNTITIKKLIYIGESGDVNDRIKNHGKDDWNAWRKQLDTNECLYFSFGAADSSSRERVEAALIYKHQPPVNTDCKESFGYDKTTINTNGKNALLKDSFTIDTTPAKV